MNIVSYAVGLKKKRQNVNLEKKKLQVNFTFKKYGTMMLATAYCKTISYMRLLAFVIFAE